MFRKCLVFFNKVKLEIVFNFISYVLVTKFKGENFVIESNIKNL